MTVGSNLQGFKSVQSVTDVGALESLLLHDCEENIGLDHGAGGRQADSNANTTRTVKKKNEMEGIQYTFVYDEPQVVLEVIKSAPCYLSRNT